MCTFSNLIPYDPNMHLVGEEVIPFAICERHGTQLKSGNQSETPAGEMNWHADGPASNKVDGVVQWATGELSPMLHLSKSGRSGGP